MNCVSLVIINSSVIILQEMAHTSLGFSMQEIACMMSCMHRLEQLRQLAIGHNPGSITAKCNTISASQTRLINAN